MAPWIGGDEREGEQSLLTQNEESEADKDDEGATSPGGDWMALQGWLVLFDRHAEHSNHYSPAFVGKFASRDGVRPFANLFHLPESEGFSCFLRELLFGRWRSVFWDGLKFAAIEPKKLAALADIHGK